MDVGLHVGITSEPSWLPLAFERGTMILLTDRSYNWKLDLTISGAGWVITCQRTGKMLKGSFFEFSTLSNGIEGTRGFVQLQEYIKMQSCCASCMALGKDFGSAPGQWSMAK
jgi:hypothetical protein